MGLKLISEKDSTSELIKSSKVEPYENARRLSVLRRQRKVLIVDDESTGRTILTKIIQQVEDDVSVSAFDNPLDALKWLDNNHPDLIITDYRMPDMNGVELIRRIQEIPGSQDIPIMMITVVSEKSVRYDALEAGATAFLTRPIDQIECRTSCRNLLKLHEQQAIIQDRADWLARQVEVATQQIVSREKETLIRLAKAGEYRDEETGFHVVRMAKYSKKIAEALGLSEKECDEIEYAAPMHDIGKIGIQDSVLLKPDKFNQEEWLAMKQHTTIGHSILSNSQSRYIQTGSIIALNHHERFDGTGYPNGIVGKDIPLVARIVSVADVYDALTSPRPYKEAWTTDDSKDYLETNSGTQFDPLCVEAFFEKIDKIDEIQFDFSDN
ncbi:MAG: two-component system response regulator [Gammaproteobacteria bacterium]|nr:MAG: two-component system response regulator [Gammaproteobacteria bacterium]